MAVSITTLAVVVVGGRKAQSEMIAAKTKSNNALNKLKEAVAGVEEL